MQQFDQSLKDEQLYRWVGNILRFGMLFSLALMVLGLLLAIVSGGGTASSQPSSTDLFSRLLTFDPFTITSLSVAALALTPVVSVFTVFVFFLFEHDYKYAFAAFIVLLMLTISVVLAI